MMSKAGLRSLVFGLWSLVFGLWSLVFGLWSLVLKENSFICGLSMSSFYVGSPDF
jgi:hypothetical protein